MNDMSSIVYISGDSSSCVKLFESRPINFHQKPLLKNDIFKDINTVMRLSGIKGTRFSFKHDRTIRGIELEKIIYFCMEQKQVKLVTQNSEFIFRDKLNEIYNGLPKTQFCRCHKSYIININYIKTIRFDSVELMNGEQIPIGRTYREQIKRFNVDGVEVIDCRIDMTKC